MSEAIEPERECEDTASQPKKEVVIRKYGLLDPLDWDQECEEELKKTTDFFNKLVDIEIDYRNIYKDIVGTNPDLEIYRQKISEIESQISEIVASVRSSDAANRRATRTASVNSAAGLKSELSKFKNLARLSYQEQKDRTRNETRAAELARREKVKLARQLSGLWWGNYNAVVDAFEQARRTASKSGRGVKHRHHDGSGRFVNQIQGGAPPEDFTDGKNIQVKVAPLAADAWTHGRRGERRRLQRTHLQATVWVRDGVRRYVTWPMIMHRPIPSDCLVKEVVVTRQRSAGRWVWAAIFFCTRVRAPREESSGGARIAAVDLGWRSMPDGIRVATILRNDGASKIVQLPRKFVDDFSHVDELRVRLYDHRRKGLDLLRSVDLRDAPSALAVQIESAAHAPATLAGNFSDLLRAWRESSWRPDIHDQLLIWRREERKLYLWEANLRKKIIGRRTHFYQMAARDIACFADIILLNKLALEEMIRSASREIRNNFYPRAANWYRLLAAQSDLTHWIAHQCAKSETRLRSVAYKGPPPCPSCGSDSRATRADVLHQTCGQCGTTWDQDLATCEAIIRAELAVQT